MPNRRLILHTGIVHEHTFQRVIYTWHFGSRSNATGSLFSTVTEAWDYGQQIQRMSSLHGSC
jgi:hypothetical protein